MARAYGMAVIAEGVETREQDRAAVRLGCQQRQGYLHHRPMSHDALLGLWKDLPTAGQLPGPRQAASRPPAGSFTAIARR